MVDELSLCTRLLDNTGIVKEKHFVDIAMLQLDLYVLHITNWAVGTKLPGISRGSLMKNRSTWMVVE